jgi:hypothetical protein
MRQETSFKVLLRVETVALIAIIAGIVFFEPERAADLWLFELVGAVSASLITTFGIYRMKELT